MEISHIKPPTANEKKRRLVKRGVAQVVGLIIKLCLAGAVLLTIVAILIVPPVAPVLPTSDELVTADDRRVNLQKLGNSQKPGTVAVTAAELNAYFNQKPFDKPTGSGLIIVPAVRRATLRGGTVKIELLATAHLGTIYDKPLYFAYEGQPTLVAGQFVFKPTGAWLGQLPIFPQLPVLMPLFEKRIVSLLQDLTGDEALLDKLTAINVTGDAVEFVKDTPAKR